MLDRRFVVENPTLVQDNIRLRKSRSVDVESFVQLEEQRRQVERDLQGLRTEANRLARERRGPEGADAAREIRNREKELRDTAQRAREQADELLAAIPNLTHPEVPAGGEEDSRELALGRTPVPTFDFPVRDHVDIGTALRILDMEAGTRVASPGFYFIQGDGVLPRTRAAAVRPGPTRRRGLRSADRARARQGPHPRRHRVCAPRG